MICKKFEELTPFEKVVFIGELVHCVQSHDALFESAKSLTKAGKSLGLLDGVTIMPEREEENIVSKNDNDNMA